MYTNVLCFQLTLTSNDTEVMLTKGLPIFIINSRQIVEICAFFDGVRKNSFADLVSAHERDEGLYKQNSDCWAGILRRCT